MLVKLAFCKLIVLILEPANELGAIDVIFVPFPLNSICNALQSLNVSD